MRSGIFAFALMSSLLTGCIEVEDSNNDDVISAIEEQVASVSVYGVVSDIYTDEALASANVTIMAGKTSLGSAQTDADGLFEIEGVPASSDISVIVEAEGYVTRLFSASTNEVESGSG